MRIHSKDMKKLFRQIIGPALERQAVRYIRRYRLIVVAVAGSLGSRKPGWGKTRAI